MNYSTFNKILGNEHAKNELINTLKTKNIPHSWLFSGPKGIGKSSLIYCFIQELFSDIPGAFERIKGKTFSDFIEITNDNNKDINVTNIREIAKFLSLTAGEGKYRVVLIDNAEYMNKFAANALLKILEEPPANSLIFVVCHNPTLLLPTIKSRCRHVKMYPLSNEDCKKVVGDELTAEITKFCNGSPGMAQELIKSNALTLYNDFLSIAVSNDIQKIYKIIDNIDNEENGYNWQIITILIARLLLDIIKIATNNKQVEHQLLEKVAKNYSVREWFKVNDKIMTMLYETNLLNFDKKHSLIIIFNLLSKAHIR